MLSPSIYSEKECCSELAEPHDFLNSLSSTESGK